MDKKLEELKKLAETNGGKLITKEWLGGKAKYQFQHADGRTFERDIKKIRLENGWPHDLDKFLKSSNAAKSTDNNFYKLLQDEAKNNNAILLSPTWLGSEAKYQFKLEDGRILEKTWNNLNQVGWPKDLDDYFKIINGQSKSDEEKIKEMIVFAERNGGKFLSKKWLGANEYHDFEFASGKQFKYSPNLIVRKGWPKENLHFALSEGHTKTDEEKLEELKNLVENNGGNLLSKEWLGIYEAHTFEYNDGRHFSTSPSYLFKISWPKNLDEFIKNSNALRKTPDELIEELSTVAKENNGKLLTKEWNGSRGVYLFEHQDGRTFEGFAETIKLKWPNDLDEYIKLQKSQRKTDKDFLKELELFASNNNGKLLTKNWNGVSSLYIFESYNNIKFEITLNKLNKDGWPKDVEKYNTLRKIALMTPEKRIAIISDIAISRSGKLLSTKWLGSRELLEFEDEYGNNFFCNPEALINGQWTKDRGLVSEPLCRQVLEHLFNESFPKNNKILNSSIEGIDNNWELDGYCDKFKIAFEYQGHASHWDANHIAYEKVVERDKLKKKICTQLGIILIQIPPIENKHKKWSSENMLSHVFSAIKETYNELNLDLPNMNLINFNVDISKVNHSQMMLSRLRNIAEEKGGSLNSKVWNGDTGVYNVTYQDGREFNISFDYLRNYGWPKNLDNFLKGSIARNKTHIELLQDLQSLAISKNIELISDKWLGSKTKHLFKFKDGKQFEQTPMDLKKSSFSGNSDIYFIRSKVRNTSQEEHFNLFKRLCRKI